MGILWVYLTRILIRLKILSWSKLYLSFLRVKILSKCNICLKISFKLVSYCHSWYFRLCFDSCLMRHVRSQEQSLTFLKYLTILMEYACTYYLLQDCFKGFWNEHKKIHKKASKYTESIGKKRINTIQGIARVLLVWTT